MLKIIQEHKSQEVVAFEHVFSYTPDRFTSGYAFDCDVDGLVKDLTKLQSITYQECMSGMVGGTKIFNLGVVKRYRWSNTPAVAQCHCGSGLMLSTAYNTCDYCGATYNSAGQALAPMEFWGEETGETSLEIL